MQINTIKYKVREKTTPKQFVKNKERETLSDLGYVVRDVFISENSSNYHLPNRAYFGQKSSPNAVKE